MCAAGQTACVPRARDGQRSPALLVGRGRNEAWLFRFRRKSRCTVQLEEEGKFSRHSIMSLQGQIALVTGASQGIGRADRKSTRLNSSHLVISYAVFCLKKKN